MFNTIVVPLDGSELAANALDPAVALARRRNAEVVLVRAVGDSRDSVEAGEELRELAEGLEGVSAKAVCLADPEPAEVIAGTAAGHKEALVCMSTHGRGGVGRTLLGSVAEGVLQRFAGPVVLLGPNAERDVDPAEGHALVCLDGSRHSEAILPFVERWVEATGVGAEFVQVVGPEFERELSASGVPPEDVNLEGYLARLGRRFLRNGVEPVDWSVLRGRRPAARLVERMAYRAPGVVMMATHGRTGLARLAVGSVAMAVVHDSPRPVLVVRPAELARDLER